MIVNVEVDARLNRQTTQTRGGHAYSLYSMSDSELDPAGDCLLGSFHKTSGGTLAASFRANSLIMQSCFRAFVSKDMAPSSTQQAVHIEKTPAADPDRWRAVLARDEKSDGTFVFAVRSTGIYCRPSCPARRPRLQQVLFFLSADEAERAGFRPCKRCRPRERTFSPQRELVRRACLYIESHPKDKLALSSLGSRLGVSPYYLQRIFKRTIGISPREYMEAHRMARLKQNLRRGESVTKATYNAGFSSRSRLYDRVPTKFGMMPGVYRRGGQGMRIRYTVVASPLGRMLVAGTDLGICAVCLGDSDSEVETKLLREYPAAEISRDDIALRNWVTALRNYFADHQHNLELPLDVQGTAFQWKVWKEIQSIPYGATSSYSRIARAIGAPNATRAVAKACATNPVPLIIPCHRVVRQDGKLGGYRWGIGRKQALLSHEENR